MHRILFVCQGNICRSPAAESLFNHLVTKEDLSHKIWADSAGTSGFHVGEPPDPRMQRTLLSHGIRMNGSARQFRVQDFERYALILAMDSINYTDIRRQAPHNGALEKLKMFLSFDTENTKQQDVPDPYYGGAHGFENVYQLVERTCHAMLECFREGKL